MTTSSSSLEIVPLPSLSKSENASRNSVQEKSSEQIHYHGFVPV